MTISIKWDHDMVFTSTTPAGHTMTLDARDKEGVCMTQALLCALGSCCATDTMLGIKAFGAKLNSFTNELTYTRTESSPKLYKTVNFNFIVDAEGITLDEIKKIALDARDNHCNNCVQLKPTIDISISVELV